MSATTRPEALPRRRKLGPGRRRNFHAPDAAWDAALEACHERGVSLGSELVRALEIIGAGKELRPGRVEHQARTNLPGNMHPGPLSRCQVPGCGPDPR